MAVFVEANPPEILRAAQKDESFIAQIRGELSDIVQRLLGNRAWLKYQWISDLSSVFLYYSLTTLLDNQTLGEEYVGLLQVDSSLRAIPSKLRRLVAITLQVFGPRMFASMMKRLDAWLRSPDNCPDLKPEARETLLKLTNFVHNSSSWISKLNLALFYIYGRYFRLSQRMARIHFVFTTDYLKTGNYRSSFRLIGLLVLAHLLLMLITNVVSVLQKSKSTLASPAEQEQLIKQSTIQGAKCSLCWEERRNPTCTPCGHLFCWDCILQWLQTKQECPLCRESVQPSRVVPLLNYE